MKRGLGIVLVLLFCMSSFSIAKDVGVEEVNREILNVGDTLREEVDEGVTRYVRGMGLVASIKENEINYYHSDFMDNNRIITNSEGVPIEESLSLPFGQLIVNSGIRYSFATGKELDSSDLYYFGARYYDSNLGRFTSVDPLSDNHAYVYVNNNPLYYVDPSGMDEEVQQEMNWFEKTIDFFLGFIRMDRESRSVRRERKVDEFEDYLMSHVFVNPDDGSSKRRTFNSMVKQMDKEDVDVFWYSGDSEFITEALNNLIQNGLVEHGWSEIGIRESKVGEWLNGEISDEELYYGGNEYYALVQYEEIPEYTTEIIHYSEPANWLDALLVDLGINEKKGRRVETKIVPARRMRTPTGLNSEPPTENDYFYLRVNTFRSMYRRGLLETDPFGAE